MAMKVQPQRIDILPKGGMDLRSPDGIKWMRNMFRLTSVSPLEVRAGFGQRAQIDTSVTMPAVNSNNGTQGYTKHLGSFLYRSRFGNRQILSLFAVNAGISDSTKADMTGTGGASKHYLTIHGVSVAVVFSVYDLTTNNHADYLVPFTTSEFADRSKEYLSLFGHFESHRGADSTGFRFESLNAVSFAQISDSVYFASPDIGTWVYRGIEVPNKRNRQRICSDNPDPSIFAADTRTSNNNHNGFSEGSVVAPVVPTPGINGKNVVYLERGDMPRSVGMANLGGRIAYTANNVVWFSDVSQPSSVMAINFAAFEADGQTTAIGSFKNNLFVFTDIEVVGFTLRPANAAGSVVPGVVDVVRAETSKEAGCVSARSFCETPYGLCFISTWGVHLVANVNKIVTISDPITAHWMEGLLDPASEFYRNSGNAGASSNRQTPIRYYHEGEPTVTYSGVEDKIHICYDDHILCYDFDSKAWGIWPLGGRDQNTTNAISYLPSFSGLTMLSDLDGDYLISGFQDLNHTLNDNPYSENPSYVIAELGLGGGLDRSIENEDFRKFGEGHYVLLQPTNSFAGGTAPALMDRTTTYAHNGWTLFVDPVDEWFETGTGTTDRVKKKSYDVSFWRCESAPDPNSALSFSLELPSGAGWTYATSEVATHAEAGTKANYTISLAATNRRLNVVTPNLGAGGSRGPVRFPMVRFTISGNTDEVNDPIFTLYAAEATEPVSGTVYAVRAIVWQASDRFRHTNQRWNAVSTVPATGGQKNATHSFDGASVHERPVQWAITTGMIGNNDGVRARLRGLRASLVTSGPDTPVSTDYDGLYNAVVGTDYKMLAGQRQDNTDPYIANREIRKKESIRNRLNAGKRTFGSDSAASTAKWSTGTSATTDYLVDEVEVNEIAISTHGKGDSFMAMVYGTASSVASKLKVQKLVAILQTFKGNRRKGR